MTPASAVLLAAARWARPAGEFVSAQRFPDSVAVSAADVTTCYPSQPCVGCEAAHDGVSVTVKGSGNERAQSINRRVTAGNLNGPRAVFRNVLWAGSFHAPLGGSFRRWS
jgi:hypothetical protein